MVFPRETLLARLTAFWRTDLALAASWILWIVFFSRGKKSV